MLNAHPEIQISNELDTLFYFENGVRGAAILGSIAAHDARFARQGRRNTKGYSYAPAGETVLRRSIATIGDKKGFPTALRLSRRPDLLKKLRVALGMSVKVIHVTRNPYDMVASFTKVTGNPVTSSWELAEMARLVERASEAVPEADYKCVRFEDICAAPEDTLASLCNFLARPHDSQSLAPGMGMVDAGLAPRADTSAWSAEALETVATLTDTHGAFISYRDDARRPTSCPSSM